MSDTVNTTSLQESEATEEVVDKLAYTKKRYLRPKEIAAFVLVNFGQKNLSQFIDGEKQFFLVQYAGLNPQHFANIQLFATIYDALDDTISGLIIDRTRTRWGRVRPFFIPPRIHKGSGRMKKGLTRPQRVLVRSMIRPESVSSRASYIVAKSWMLAKC